MITTTVTLDQASDQDISLGTINLQDDVVAYLNENQPDAESFTIIEVVPASGSIVTQELFNLSFVEELEIYAIQEGREILIGRSSSTDIGATPSVGIQGIDQNLYLFGQNDDIDIVLRPEYTDIGTQITTLNVDVRFALNYSVTGIK